MLGGDSFGGRHECCWPSGCLADVFRPCTVLVESHSKVLCCVSHIQYMPVNQRPTLPGQQCIEVCLEVFGVLLRVDIFVNQTLISKHSFKNPLNETPNSTRVSCNLNQICVFRGMYVSSPVRLKFRSISANIT